MNRGLERWQRECCYLVHISVPTPHTPRVEDLVKAATQYSDWLQERGVLLGDFMVDSAPPRKGYMSWIYRFRNPDVAMLFKLTWGGV